MQRSTSESLVCELQTEIGTALRLVARYDDGAFDVLYVRDDVENVGSGTDGSRLHERVLDDRRDRSALVDSLEMGELRASVLAFEEGLCVNVFGDDDEGHVTMLDWGTPLDVHRFLRRFDVARRRTRRSADVRVEPRPVGRDCPRCGSSRTVSTPRAGPDAPYHCRSCDSSFS